MERPLLVTSNNGASSSSSLSPSGSDSQVRYARYQPEPPARDRRRYRLQLPRHFHVKPAIGIISIGAGVIASAFAISLFIAALSEQGAVSTHAVADMSLAIGCVCIVASAVGLAAYSSYRQHLRRARPAWEPLTQSAHDVEIQLLRFLLAVCMVASITLEIHILRKHTEIEKREDESHEHLTYDEVTVHVCLWIIAYLLMGMCMLAILDPEYIDHLRRHRGRNYYVMQYVLGALFWIMITDTVYIFYVLPENKLFLPMHDDTSPQSTVIFTYYPLLAGFNMHIFFAVGLAFVLLRKIPRRIWEPTWTQAHRRSLVAGQQRDAGRGIWVRLKYLVRLRMNGSWIAMCFFICLLIYAPFAPINHSDSIPIALICFQLLATVTKMYLAYRIGHFSRARVAESQEMRVLLMALVFFVILNAASILRVIFGATEAVDQSVVLRTVFRSFELFGVPIQAAVEMYFLHCSYTHDAMNSQYDRSRIRLRKQAYMLFILAAMCNIVQYFLSLLLEAAHLKLDVTLPQNCSNITAPQTHSTAQMTSSSELNGTEAHSDALFGHLWYIIEVACVPWIVEVYLILAMFNVTSAELIGRLRALEKPVWKLRSRILMVKSRLNTHDHAVSIGDGRERIDAENPIEHLDLLEQYAIRSTNCKQLLQCGIVPLLLNFIECLERFDQGDANEAVIFKEEVVYNGICRVLCVLSRYKPAREAIAAHDGAIEFMWQIHDACCDSGEAEIISRVAGAMWMYAEDDTYADEIQARLLMRPNPHARHRCLRGEMYEQADAERRRNCVTHRHSTRMHMLIEHFTSPSVVDFEAVSGLLFAAARILSVNEDQAIVSTIESRERLLHFLVDPRVKDQIISTAAARIKNICEENEGTALELGNNLGLIDLGMAKNEEKDMTIEAPQVPGMSPADLFNLAVNALLSQKADARSRGFAAKLIGRLGQVEAAWDSARTEAITAALYHSMEHDPDDTQMDVIEATFLLSNIVQATDSMAHEKDILAILCGLGEVLLEKLPRGRQSARDIIVWTVANGLLLEKELTEVRARRPEAKSFLDIVLHHDLRIWSEMTRFSFEREKRGTIKVLCSCVKRKEFWNAVSPGDVLTFVPVICTGSDSAAVDGISLTNMLCIVKDVLTDSSSNSVAKTNALAAYFALVDSPGDVAIPEGIVDILFSSYDAKFATSRYYLGNLLGILVNRKEFWVQYATNHNKILWEALTHAFPWQLRTFESTFRKLESEFPTESEKLTSARMHFNDNSGTITRQASRLTIRDRRDSMLS